MTIYRRKYPDKKTGEMKLSRYWSYCGSDGRRVSLRVTNERAALLAAAELEKLGGLTPYDRTRRTPPLTLIEEYLAELRASNVDAEYPGHVRTELARIFDGLKSIAELNPERITAILERLARVAPPHKRRPQGGLSPLTRNKYRTTLSLFFNWLVRQDRWPKNPVRATKCAKVRGRVHERDPIEAEELAALIRTAPIRRAACYALAMTTGLRRKEIAALVEDDLDLEAGTVRARASTTKNAKESLHAPPAETIELLRRHLAVPGSRRGRRLFVAIPLPKTLRADLASAGVDLRGRSVDFHSLRVSYCTWLARIGVPLQQAQHLMRHSSPALTATIYTRVELHDARAVAARLSLGVQGSVPSAGDNSLIDASKQREPASRTDNRQKLVSGA